MSMLTQKLQLRFGTSNMRKKALAWMAACPHPEANGLLSHSLGDPNEAVRAAAIEALAARARKDAGAIMLLVDALNHQDPQVNKRALNALVMAVKKEFPFTVENALGLLLGGNVARTVDALRKAAASDAVYLLLQIAPAQVVAPLVRLPGTDPDRVLDILEIIVAGHLSGIPTEDLQELANKGPSETVLSYGRHGSLGGSSKTTVHFTHLNKLARWELIRRGVLVESEPERAARLRLDALRNHLIAILGSPKSNGFDRLLARSVLGADDKNVPAALREYLHTLRREMSSQVKPAELLSLLGPLMEARDLTN
jgi:hypothetical protein